MNRYEIEYGTLDGNTGAIVERMTTVRSGHDAEHALDKFDDSEDGFIATRIRKLAEHGVGHGA